MTSQRDPFGPPPTEPPTIGNAPADQTSTTTDPSTADRRLGDGGRVALIWSGAITTIGFSGATGLLLESQWSYLTLGATFAALLLVVVVVSSPSGVSR